MTGDHIQRIQFLQMPANTDTNSPLYLVLNNGVHVTCRFVRRSNGECFIMAPKLPFNGGYAAKIKIKTTNGGWMASRAVNLTRESNGRLVVDLSGQN